MAACELGFFEVLASAPASVEELAARTGLTCRAARICADAMVAVGMLHREGDMYVNSKAAAAHLTPDSPTDLRPYIALLDRISYPAWVKLVDVLRHGPEARVTNLDPELQQLFSEGVEAVNVAPAAALAATSHFSTCHRLLDVGGGTGSWSIALVRAHPNLTATVFELPQVVAIASQRIAKEGLSDRIEVVGGDVHAADLPTDHDCCLVSNLIHYFSAEENRRLLANIRRAVDPGVRLFIADYWTDPTHAEPLLAAMMAGEYAVNIEHGDVYSLAEGLEWLEATRWQFLAHEPLVDAKSLLVAEAV